MSLEGDSYCNDDDCNGECEYCNLYDSCHLIDNGEEDSGFLGSMLESQLCKDGQVICEVCGKKVGTVLNSENPNTCKTQIHQDFKRLFDMRIKIGLHDLETRGYD